LGPAPCLAAVGRKRVTNIRNQIKVLIRTSLEGSGVMEGIEESGMHNPIEMSRRSRVKQHLAKPCLVGGHSQMLFALVSAATADLAVQDQ
jgi:hypothetical protein